MAAAERRFPEFPEVRGRVNRLKGGRIGRFGRKAETPDLRAFVLTACANGLGLEVPGHRQAASPLGPGAKAKGLDLAPEECEALVVHVRHLPAPTGGVGGPAGSSSARAAGAPDARVAHNGVTSAPTPARGEWRVPVHKSRVKKYR